MKALKAVLEMAETSVVSVLVEMENSMDSNNLDKGRVDWEEIWKILEAGLTKAGFGKTGQKLTSYNSKKLSKARKKSQTSYLDPWFISIYHKEHLRKIEQEIDILQ
jgi:hypothetical protein